MSHHLNSSQIHSCVFPSVAKSLVNFSFFCLAADSVYDPEAYGVDEWGLADESALGAAAGKAKKARKPRNKAGPKKAAPKKGPNKLVQMIQPPTNPQPATKSKKAPLTAPSNSSALFNALLPGRLIFVIEVCLFSHITL